MSTSTSRDASLYVLDTKTSKLWIRTKDGDEYLGTNEKPELERISRRVKVKTFEEIGKSPEPEQK